MVCQECDSLNTKLEILDDWEGIVYKVICNDCGHSEIIDKDLIDNKLEEEDDR